MNQILIQELVKPSQALRRTKLVQGDTTLYNNGKYCALGAIAHELLGFDGREFDRNDDEMVKSWYDRLNGLLGGVENVRNIYMMNDIGWSFNAIASWLEERGL